MEMQLWKSAYERQWNLEHLLHSDRTLDNLQLSFLKELTHDSSVEVALIFNDFFKSEDTTLLWEWQVYCLSFKEGKIDMGNQTTCFGNAHSAEAASLGPKTAHRHKWCQKLFPNRYKSNWAVMGIPNSLRRWWLAMKRAGTSVPAVFVRKGFVQKTSMVLGAPTEDEALCSSDPGAQN